MNDYKIKIYIKKKRFAFLTVQCTKEFAQDIIKQLNSDKQFITIVTVVINKGEIRYAAIKKT